MHVTSTVCVASTMSPIYAVVSNGRLLQDVLTDGKMSRDGKNHLLDELLFMLPSGLATWNVTSIEYVNNY